MTNRIHILRSANRTLAKLPRNVQDRIDEAIDDLSQDSRPPGAKRLVGDEPIYRIRVGDYRILVFVQAIIISV